MLPAQPSQPAEGTQGCVVWDQRGSPAAPRQTGQPALSSRVLAVCRCLHPVRSR